MNSDWVQLGLVDREAAERIAAAWKAWEKTSMPSKHDPGVRQ